jgi:hypothetical protein
MPIIPPPIDRDAFTKRVVEDQGEHPLAMLDQAVSFMPEGALRIYRATKLAEWGEVDVEALTAALVERVKTARMKPHLFYLDRGDEGFHPEQVQALLDGENMYEADAFTMLTENMDENLHVQSVEYVKTEVCETDEERDALDADLDAFEEVRQTVMDLDESNWYQDFLRASHNMLFRYAVDHEVNPWASQYDESIDNMDDERTALAAALGVDAAAHKDTLDSILNECAYYGGSVEVIWYGDAESALALAAPDALLNPDDDYKPFPQAPTLGTVTFTDVHVLVRDGLNGAGMDAKFEGQLTLPWVAGRATTDKAGPGYSWTSIAGPYEPAYAATFETKPTEPTES